MSTDDSEIELDTGTRDASREPVRKCLVTGDRKPVAELIRFVIGPGDTVVPDLAAKLPGRGMWLSADAQGIMTAQDKRLFARAARQNVVTDPDLPERVEKLLAERIVQAISLARRAGEAVAGFDKVQAALEAKTVSALIQARDGAVDGRNKLAAKARDGVAVLAVLDAFELGSAFGRDTAVHVALQAGGLCDRIVMDCRRLIGFRSGTADGRPTRKDVG